MPFRGPKGNLFYTLKWTCGHISGLQQLLQLSWTFQLSTLVKLTFVEHVKFRRKYSPLLYILSLIFTWLGIFSLEFFTLHGKLQYKIIFLTLNKFIWNQNGNRIKKIGSLVLNFPCSIGAMLLHFLRLWWANLLQQIYSVRSKKMTQ